MRKDVPVLYHINEYIAKMGENYVSIMDNYFDAFKDKMYNRFKIPKNFFEDYKYDIFLWLIMIKCIYKQSD